MTWTPSRLRQAAGPGVPSVRATATSRKGRSAGSRLLVGLLGGLLGVPALPLPEGALPDVVSLPVVPDELDGVSDPDDEAGSLGLLLELLDEPPTYPELPGDGVDELELELELLAGSVGAGAVDDDGGADELDEDSLLPLGPT